MFKTDFLNFQKLINRIKKEHFEELPIYYMENKDSFDLFLSENNLTFKTTVQKDVFAGEFREKYLTNAVKVDIDTPSDKELLRTGLMAELDAINQYENLSNKTDNKVVKDVFESIIKEEKTHAGEFQAILLTEDKEQKTELIAGKKEVL